MNNIDRVATDIIKQKAYEEKNKQCSICNKKGERGFHLASIVPITWICINCAFNGKLNEY